MAARNTKHSAKGLDGKEYLPVIGRTDSLD